MSTWSTPVQPELTPEDNLLLEQWYEAQKSLALLKVQEMELRKKAVARFFNEDDREGTMRYPLPDGFKLKAVKKQNYKLKNDAGQTDAALEKLSEDMAGMLVKWTPDLSVSNYKKLAPELQAVFNDCLEITDASPTLEIEAPKTK